MMAGMAAHMERRRSWWRWVDGVLDAAVDSLGGLAMLLFLLGFIGTVAGIPALQVTFGVGLLALLVGPPFLTVLAGMIPAPPMAGGWLAWVLWAIWATVMLGFGLFICAALFAALVGWPG